MSSRTSLPDPVARSRAWSIYEPRGSEDSKLTLVKARGSLIWDADGRSTSIAPRRLG